jgi:hypothetical protein
MKNIEGIILKIFKANPSKEYDTSELTREIFPEEYSTIIALLASADKSHVNDAKRKKFQLHRKLLYYLNKLVDEKILRVSKIQEKGEKSFALELEEGDIIIERGHKKISITKPSIMSNHIEVYEHNHIMKKYDENTWVYRINSMMLECSKIPTTEKLYLTISDCFRNVNDVIALNDFEILVNSISDAGNDSGMVAMKSLLDKFSEDTQNFDKVISMIINFSELKYDAAKKFIEYFSLIILKG